MLFTGQTVGHRTLTGVYFNPRLRNNIVSLDQLDKNGCQVLIEDGVLRIRDRQLLAKVQRTRTRLYVLNLQITQPVCLSARCADDAWGWYARYGHLHFDALRKLGRKKMVRCLPLIDPVD